MSPRQARPGQRLSAVPPEPGQPRRAEPQARIFLGVFCSSVPWRGAFSIRRKFRVAPARARQGETPEFRPQLNSAGGAVQFPEICDGLQASQSGISRAIGRDRVLPPHRPPTRPCGGRPALSGGDFSRACGTRPPLRASNSDSAESIRGSTRARARESKSGHFCSSDGNNGARAPCGSIGRIPQWLTKR